MYQAMDQHKVKVNLVREALGQLHGHVKTAKLVKDKIYQLHEDAAPMSKHVVAHIMKELGFVFRKPQLRMIQSMRDDVRENRHVYKCFFKALILNKARFIWIDETSFNPKNVKCHSWVSANDPYVFMY